MNTNFFEEVEACAKSNGVNFSVEQLRNSPNLQLENDLCLGSGELAIIAGNTMNDGLDFSGGVTGESTLGELVAYADSIADIG